METKSSPTKTTNSPVKINALLQKLQTLRWKEILSEDLLLCTIIHDSRHHYFIKLLVFHGSIFFSGGGTPVFKISLYIALWENHPSKNLEISEIAFKIWEKILNCIKKELYQKDISLNEERILSNLLKSEFCWWTYSALLFNVTINLNVTKHIFHGQRNL